MPRDKEKSAAYGKKYYAEHREELESKRKIYVARHREERVYYANKYYAEHREEQAARDLMRKYGITLADRETMFTKQNGKCAICGTEKPGGRNNAFQVDHDHETGKVRGLLCYPCNSAIGLLRDNTEILASAITYLKGYRP